MLVRKEQGSGSISLNGENTGGGVSRLRRDAVRELAREAGFTEAGIVALPHHHEQRDAERFEKWLEDGRAGTMEWLARRNEDGARIRARAGIPFPWARSVIVCMASYFSSAPRSTDAAPQDAGWIARYAITGRTEADGEIRPSDYHRILLKRLRGLEARLRETCGEMESRAYVETGPVVERSLAVAAGLGWQGKNTCLIHPRHGSYTFLAALITSLEVEEAARIAPVPDRCGSCRRCIEACPTNALVAPYEMDAARCIAYLTIEHKGTIKPELMEQTGRQVFGCDICQDVCPWNGKLAREGTQVVDSGLAPRGKLVNPTLDWLASLDESAFEKTFN